MSELQIFANLSEIVLLIIISPSFWFVLKTVIREWCHKSRVE
ncbi:MAG TPA: hypothetical protein VFY83_09380 [Anaerolineales bacterium]|nr:hypothetical protein [Anaerolineales bacterium]